MSWRAISLLWNLALVLAAYTEPALAQRFVKQGTLTGHRNMVSSVAFSPDGETLVSGSVDTTLRIWDVTSARERRLLRAHSGPFSVNEVRYAPVGNMLALASDARIIAVWDTPTLQRRTVLSGYGEGVASIAFSSDANELASVSWSGTVKVWDMLQEKVKADFRGPPVVVRWVSLSPDGLTLAVASYDDIIQLWDVESGELLSTTKGHAPCFSHDGATLALSRGDAGQIILWDVKAMQMKGTLGEHGGWVASISFSPGGRLLASSGTGVKLWDVSKRKNVISPRTDSWISAIAFSHNGHLLAYGEDKRVKIWNVEARSPKTTLSGHLGAISSISFSPDGNFLASSGKAVKVWDLGTGTETAQIEPTTGYHAVRAVAYSHDGSLFASAGEDGIVKVWDAKSMKERCTLRGHDSTVACIAFSPDGSTLASGSYDTTVRLWDIRKRLCTAKLTHGDIVRSVAFAPTRARLASGGADGKVRIWDTTKATCLRTLTGHKGQLRSVAFSHSGDYLASASDGGSVKLWNPQNGRCVATVKAHAKGALSVAFSPDDKTFASGSWRGGVIKLWNTETHELTDTLEGQDGITCLTFARHGKILASASRDGTIVLWTASGD